MSYFEIKSLKKTYPNKTISLDLDLEKNDFLSIVGKSGAGKSTILKLISGLTDFDKSKETKIILEGKEIHRLPPGKRQVGLLFQENALFQNMNVGQNIGFGLKMAGMSRKDVEYKVRQYLSYFDLEGYEKRTVESLSGGEAQRVNLARTLITEPKLLLLDEPFSALDEKLKMDLENLILKIKGEKNLTVIMVSHDLEQSLRMGNKILVMQEGKTVLESSSTETCRERILELL